MLASVAMPGVAARRTILAVVAVALLAGAVAIASERSPAPPGVARQPPSPQPTAGSPPALAHLWVDRNGGTCMRSADTVPYRDASACGSLGDAYTAANAGRGASKVLIKGGRFGAQTIVGDRPAGGRISFDEAPGEDAQFGGLITLGVGPDGIGPSQGPDRIRLRNITTARLGSSYVNADNRFGIFLLPGTSSVTIENATQGGFLVQGARDITFDGGSFGPCRAAPLGEENPCEINKVDHALCTRCAPRDIVVDGVDFHDYDYGPECVEQGDTGPDGCHHRAMYINGVDGFTLRNSTFRDSVFAPWTTHSGPQAGAVGTRHVLVENNQFGARAVYAAGSYAEAASTLQFGWCQNARQPSYRDVVVRFNSFAPGATIDVPGLSPEEAGCSVKGFEVYGNVLAAPSECGVDGITWHHNVYLDAPGASCGEGDLGGPVQYRDPTPSPRPGAYELAGPHGTADDAVPADGGCPETDARGRRRGHDGRCDAGAFERP